MTEPAAEPVAAGGIGAELARVREEQGLALADVAQRLKFAPRQLEALEQDRFDLLPGATFVRGMVRNYARLLKLEAEPLLSRIGDRLDAPDAARLAARYSQPVPFSDNARRSTMVYLGASLAVLVAVGGIAYQWYHERHLPEQTAAVSKVTVTPAQAAVPQPEAPVKDAGESAAPKQVAEAPAKAPAVKPAEPQRVTAAAAEPAKAKLEEKTLPAENSSAPAAIPAEKAAREKAIAAAPLVPGVHRIVLRCEAEAWLEVQDVNGRQLLSSLNPAGCERVVQGRGPFTIVIGNASHVQVMHNNRPVDLKPHTKLDIARFTLP